MWTSRVAAGGLLAIFTLLAGCYGGGGGGGPYTPIAAELLDGVAKSNLVGRALVRQQAEELSLGQPILDRTGSLGGRGRFTIDVRGSMGGRQMPVVEQSPISTVTQDAPRRIVTENATGQVVTANAAVGIWRGRSIGTTHILGLDLIGGVSLHSGRSLGELTVARDGKPFTMRYGFRVGLLEETDKLPGVAVTYLRQHAPDLTYRWSERVGDDHRTVQLEGRSVMESKGWRISAGKHFGAVGLSAGFGRDKFAGGVNTRAAIPGGQEYSSGDGSAGTIWNLFGGLAYRVGPATIVGEVHHRNRQSYDWESDAGDGKTSYRRTGVTVGVAIGR